MQILTTPLDSVLLLVPTPHRDDRGFFSHTFDAEIFDEYVGEAGASARFVQDSQSRSVQGVVRGMHGRSGDGEGKLVRCCHGEIFDVLVDIRPDSPTFGRKHGFRLDDREMHHLYVPPGFLHGLQAVSEVADVCYRIDRPHDPDADLSVAYDDPDLAIEWPAPVTVVSERDSGAGTWGELLRKLR